jgi:hypothetical protein
LKNRVKNAPINQKSKKVVTQILQDNSLP